MRILITGGGGFIGAWLARRLAAGGHQLRVLEPVERSVQFSRMVGSAAASVEWRIGDITDAEVVRAAAKGCDGIVHLAGVLTPACKAAGVKLFPSWQFGADPPKEGVLSLEALRDKTGCSLP